MAKEEMPEVHDVSVSESSDILQSSRKPSKKQQILQLYGSGITDPVELAAHTDARPSYVAQVLTQAGLLEGYFDLYTTTARDQNTYSRYFRGVLSFKDVQSARASVARIDELYRHFEEIGDRAGQHQAMVIALTGQNRARWIGKQREAAIFHAWLCTH
ncbi:hypothetical protein [Gloeobacter kilaueensis]|uniref:Uncharacterized protein n=1 Tax=Gloeobacter kilaueensis (strain ATCC BAA-2537 / CCAP 1431/1 / ULC 316 / JS1) TaxID=1183438 RepID=U5QM04_GLOK1|nr:hypothetical protein [Gloeobacter kilaueensis]AGY59941.1 hypothetical protein GKIL_3695 [Gloeobacter kilaueensis JS1]